MILGLKPSRVLSSLNSLIFNPLLPSSYSLGSKVKFPSFKIQFFFSKIPLLASIKELKFKSLILKILIFCAVLCPLLTLEI